MRVAALYDIHGNAFALEAVLAEVRALEPDAIVVGGDVVAGPFPVETLALLEDLGTRARFVRGNADREVVEAAREGREVAPASRANPWETRAGWVAGCLTRRQIDFLAALPLTLVIEVEALGPSLFCHASPRSDEEVFTRVTPEARVAEMLAGVEQKQVVSGHTHVQFDRRVGRWRAINAGSVGMAYEGAPFACWALLGPEVELRRTPYDHERAAKEVARTSFPGAEEYARRYILSPPAGEEATALFEELADKRARAGGGHRRGA